MLFNHEKIVTLRKELHQNPELSDNESETAKRLISFLSKYKGAQIISGIGGHGIACIFKGKEEGKSVLFRCDMDALPIEELNEFEYASVKKGVSHKCGHDGHMAIMAGLAETFSNNPPQKGQAVLLFQPAEENGQGAYRVVTDEKFIELNVDYVFALHNLPGFNKGNIILSENTFASASRGMIIKLKGKTSHAGEPHNGISPAIAMADMIKELNSLPKKGNYSDYSLVTIIHAKLGEVAFGTSPGEGVVMATLRCHTNNDMEKLILDAEKIAKDISIKNKLKFKISYVEDFPAVENNKRMTKLVQKASEINQFEFEYIKTPFKWSEDFSHFTQQFKGALFGLGSGINHPQLHNPDYDFPDEIIEYGIHMFYKIFKEIENNKYYD